LPFHFREWFHLKPIPLLRVSMKALCLFTINIDILCTQFFLEWFDLVLSAECCDIECYRATKTISQFSKIPCLDDSCENLLAVR
jgi:hypothetical protein